MKCINTAPVMLRCTVILSFLFILTPSAEAQTDDLVSEARESMLQATQFMVEKVSTRGGYVWHYYDDFSRRWGELEAYDTQIWIQPSGGTVGMGDIFLNAYDATGEEYYYRAAEKAANALIWGQHEAGGWNYLVDFAGDRSLKRWYDTIGKNAWGFEEFYHYYGNATFDDYVTTSAAQFLLRIYLVKLDPSFKPALDKAIDFILESQYPLGGWPQRYPLKNEFSKDGLPDYSSFYTFNDDVIRNNIEFLINCYLTLGEERFLDPIRRGMNFYLITQQGNPQAGWGLQYKMELEPASARTYEPPSVRPATTYNHTMLLMDFYKYTGDRKFLARIPDAIEFLENSRLPEETTEGGRYTHAAHLEPGTNKPIYNHRSGSNVRNGRYWWDYSDENVIRHYGQKTTVNIDRLRQEYERVNALSPDEATKNSPLKVEPFQGVHTPQQYYDLSLGSSSRVPDPSEVESLIHSLDSQGRWLSTGERISDPYTVSETGEESNTALHGDEYGAPIRDASDRKYISTRVYSTNMSLLINYLNQQAGN